MNTNEVEHEGIMISIEALTDKVAELETNLENYKTAHMKTDAVKWDRWALGRVLPIESRLVILEKENKELKEELENHGHTYSRGAK